jgi:hypothetical protein
MSVYGRRRGRETIVNLLDEASCAAFTRCGAEAEQ